MLNGDGTDEKLLQSENVGEMDVFCALTNDDENNIMSSLLAKRMGARKVIALINRSAYVDLVQGGKIDIALSPAQVTIGSLLAYVRQGDVAAVHSLRRGAAEALELVAHGDRQSSQGGRPAHRRDRSAQGRDHRRDRARRHERRRRDGKSAAEHQVLIAHHDTVIEADDHVIVFVVNKRMVPKVEKLFQVGSGSSDIRATPSSTVYPTAVSGLHRLVMISASPCCCRSASSLVYGDGAAVRILC